MVQYLCEISVKFLFLNLSSTIVLKFYFDPFFSFRVLTALVNSFVPETFTTEVLLNDRCVEVIRFILAFDTSAFITIPGEHKIVEG